jgi:hypothetical protein
VGNKIWNKVSFDVFLTTALKPYSNYSVSVEVCTRVGCTRSKEVRFQTKDDLPEGNRKYQNLDQFLAHLS